MSPLGAVEKQAKILETQVSLLRRSGVNNIRKDVRTRTAADGGKGKNVCIIMIYLGIFMRELVKILQDSVTFFHETFLSLIVTKNINNLRHTEHLVDNSGFCAIIKDGL